MSDANTNPEISQEALEAYVPEQGDQEDGTN